MLDTGTAGPSTTVQDDSPTLADFAGDMFGDMIPSGALPADDGGSEAGTPPAPSASPADTANGSEGHEADAERAGAPPVDAASTEARPDGAAPDTLNESGTDALEGYAPLTYTTDGQLKTVDGISVHPEYGAIVDPAFLPTLQQRLSERDHLYETNRAQYARFQSLENATKWPVQNPQTGQTEYKSGLEAIEASRVAFAQSAVMAGALEQILTGKVAPESLLAWKDDANHPQGGQIVWNDAALKQMRDRLNFDADRASWQIRRGLDQFRSGTAQPTEAAQDVPASAHANATIDAIAQSNGLANLTPDAKAFLASQFEQYVRPTTAEERRQDPTLGPRIVDERFVALVQRESARLANEAKTATSAAKAAEQNAARMAAAAAGTRRPAPTATQRPAAPQPSQRALDQADAWDRHERAAATMIRQRR